MKKFPTREELLTNSTQEFRHTLDEHRDLLKENPNWDFINSALPEVKDLSERITVEYFAGNDIGPTCYEVTKQPPFVILFIWKMLTMGGDERFPYEPDVHKVCPFLAFARILHKHLGEAVINLFLGEFRTLEE